MDWDDSVALLSEIRKSLPWWPIESIDDAVQEVAVLVLEGRVRRRALKSDLAQYLPALRKRYKTTIYDISLDSPVGEEDSETTLGELISEAAPLPKKRCPICRKKVKAGDSYCGRTCAAKAAAADRKVIDPKELERLNKERWMSRDDLAKAFGVTRHGINNIISRYGLSRKNPETCKIENCDKPTRRIEHVTGYLTGTLCDEHFREKARAYSKKHRDKTRTPLTDQQRKEHARKASLARWEKQKNESARPS